MDARRRCGAAPLPLRAAHNSARFTYVSPASTLKDGTHLAYFQFRLCPDAREPKRDDPALGWVLSAESGAFMRWQLGRACGNELQLKALLGLVGAPGN